MALAYRALPLVSSWYPVSFLQAVISRLRNTGSSSDTLANFFTERHPARVRREVRRGPREAGPAGTQPEARVHHLPRGRLPPRARTRTRSRTSGKQDAERARCADDRFASMRRNHAERHGDGAPAATPAARSRPRARTELRAPSSCTVPLYCFTKRTSRTFIFYPDCENTSVVTCRYL